MPSSSTRTFLENASQRYNEEITAEGVEYLTGRGIEPETIETFRLGVVADPLPGHEPYRGFLAIPYLTPSGSVTSIRFRRLSGDGPKYLTVAGDIPRIYNTAALERGTRGICICEGELDAIIAEQCGLPAVGIPGAAAWQKVWVRLFEPYDQVMTLSDDDEAGRAFVTKLAKALGNVRDVPMAGGDVTTFFLTHGGDALRRKVLGK
ncbi:toprim domain-containing protein [Spirillospora sp. NPDC127200]